MAKSKRVEMVTREEMLGKKSDAGAWHKTRPMIK